MAGIDWSRPELIWFIVGAVLLVAELMAPGLVIFFFGLGAWCVALSCFVLAPGINIQLTLFLVVSLLLLLTLRQRLRQVFVGRGRSGADEEETDNQSAMIGRQGRLVQEIAPGSPGRVELAGTSWQAVASTALPAGSVVEVIGQQGITLTVKAVNGGGEQA